MRRLSLRDDTGAVAPFAAILMVVLLGFGALVVDVGRLYAERRVLQNGADAAALAIATDCAKGRPCNAGANTPTATALANSNSGDSASNVDSVTYPTAVSVRVVTSTSQNGATFIPPTFAKVLDPTFTGKTVHASATAAWGGIGTLTTLPLTFSSCEFNAATSNGTVFASGPPFTSPTVTITFQSGTGPHGPADCAAQAGQDTDGDTRLPGGFGWLEGSGCSATIDAFDWVKGSPGASDGNQCALETLLNTTVLLPIFDDVDPNRFRPRSGYHIRGFAAFHIVGMRFPRENHPPSCPASAGKCLVGHYVRFVATSGDTGGPPNMGTSVVVLSD